MDETDVCSRWVRMQCLGTLAGVREKLGHAAPPGVLRQTEVWQGLPKEAIRCLLR